MPFANSSWFRTIHSHFVLCTMLGLIVLDASRESLTRLLDVEGGPPVREILSGSLLSGVVVAGATWAIHGLWFRRLRKRYSAGTPVEEGGRVARRGAVVGFLCGALCPLYVFVPVLMEVLALVYLVLIVGYFRAFLARAAVTLRPGNHPRPSDVAGLVYLYAAIVACFTVLNVSLMGLHRLLGDDSIAFRGFVEGTSRLIDIFYFTVVVMTTLGFGDITPVTADAKLVVAFEVVIAYLMFALLIGTITRGILPHEADEDSAQEEPPESR